jgi:exodeoxyribonuclease VII small subunit
MSKQMDADLQNLSYEAAFKELEEIVTLLETNQQSLEESMKLYERGQALSKHCANLLEKAELKIQQLANVNPTPTEGE